MSQNTVIRLDKPAKSWQEGLPFGNGKQGGVVCGLPGRERVALNHEWLYTGKYRTREIIPPPENALGEVRALIAEGKYAQATRLANESFAPTGGTRSKESRQRVDPLQPAGDLYIAVAGARENGYTRTLDMESAAVRVACGGEDSRLNMDFYAVYPDGPIVAELSVRGGELDAAISLSRIADPECAVYYERPAANRLLMHGEFSGGVKFEICLLVRTAGRTEPAGRDGLRVSGTEKAVLLIDITTNARTLLDGSGPPKPRCRERFSTEPARLFHLIAWKRKFDACRIEIDAPAPAEFTDKRVEDFKNGGDPSLPALWYNYAKYLLLSSAGELPPSLQGIWNERTDPPWDSDFHLNINLQMNYWHAEASGLACCAEPLFDFAEGLLESGGEAAEKLYGCGGVCLPLQTDAWRRATPEAHGWAVWTGAAAWLAAHFRDRYEYSPDAEFLEKRAYPFFRACAEFYADYLYETPEGNLRFAPSQSPENTFEGGGSPVSICYDCALDLDLCAMVFDRAAAYAELLGADKEKAQRWRGLLSRLPKPKIAPDGALMEFPEPFLETEPGHRHFSHLSCVFPLGTVDGESDPARFAAAYNALEKRLSHGGGHTGWSRAWVSCLYAVFGMGDEALFHLRALIGDFATESLLDLHPPGIFQIDGNFGGAAAVLEMLISDRNGKITLLPALPHEWTSGRVRGLRARGGFVLDFDWSGGKVEYLRITSAAGEKINISAEQLAPGLAGEYPVQNRGGKEYISPGIATGGEVILCGGT